MIRGQQEISKKHGKVVAVPVIPLSTQENLEQKMGKIHSIKKIPIFFNFKKEKEQVSEHSGITGPMTLKYLHQIKDTIRSKKQAQIAEVANTPKKKLPLISASKTRLFLLDNGQTIKNLIELKEIVSKMPTIQFRTHINSEKNDFYNWIKDVLNDKDCAEDIKHARTQNLFIEQIDTHLKKYSL